MATASSVGSDRRKLTAATEKLYGVTHVAQQLGISRGYVSFLARHRMFPFLPTHECLNEGGNRRQSLFTADRVALIAHYYTNSLQPGSVKISSEVAQVYGISYLASQLGCSRTWLSPLVQERVDPFWPTHELVRDTAARGILLFAAEKIEQIVAVRRNHDLTHRVSSGVRD